MRKYDLSEIDRMRSATQMILDMVSGDRTGKTAEDHLRTYMLNGTDPEELEQYAKLTRDKFDLEWRIKDAERLIKQHSCQHEWRDGPNIIAEDGKLARVRECQKCCKSERVPK